MPGKLSSDENIPAGYRFISHLKIINSKQSIYSEF